VRAQEPKPAVREMENLPRVLPGSVRWADVELDKLLFTVAVRLPSPLCPLRLLRLA
jgi:hypothetical protein